MKIASAWLIIDSFGSTVPKVDLTPAEVQFLCVTNLPIVGKFPISDLKETGDVQRTDTAELARLGSKYGIAKVQALFGKVNPKLPVTFKAALQVPGAPEEEIDAPTKDEIETKK